MLSEPGFIRLIYLPGGEIGKAHGEFFREIKPAATMVEVSRLINPEILVEIEFSAIAD